MASLSDIQKRIQSATYTQRSEDELKTQAQNEYQSQLNNALLSAQQTYDTQNNTLENKKAETNTSYNQQSETQTATNAQNYSSVDRGLLQRGMQRSTYGATKLTNTALAGDKALANIEQNRTDALNSIATQQSNLASTLASSQTQARNTYEGNVLKRIQELKDTERQRETDSQNTLNNQLLELYGLQLSREQLDLQRALGSSF